MTSPNPPARLNLVLLGLVLPAVETIAFGLVRSCGDGTPLRQAVDLDHLDAELLPDLDHARGSRVSPRA